MVARDGAPSVPRHLCGAGRPPSTWWGWAPRMSESDRSELPLGACRLLLPRPPLSHRGLQPRFGLNVLYFNRAAAESALGVRCRGCVGTVRGGEAGHRPSARPDGIEAHRRARTRAATSVRRANLALLGDPNLGIGPRGGNLPLTWPLKGARFQSAERASPSPGPWLTKGGAPPAKAWRSGHVSGAAAGSACGERHVWPRNDVGGQPSRGHAVGVRGARGAARARGGGTLPRRLHSL